MLSVTSVSCSVRIRFYLHDRSISIRTQYRGAHCPSIYLVACTPISSRGEQETTGCSRNSGTRQPTFLVRRGAKRLVVGGPKGVPHNGWSPSLYPKEHRGAHCPSICIGSLNAMTPFPSVPSENRSSTIQPCTISSPDRNRREFSSGNTCERIH